jgi:hypothetical protein
VSKYPNDSRGRVFQAVEDKLATAKDDLRRAKRRFRRVIDLDQLYGESGQTCREILRGYKNQVGQWEYSLDWLQRAAKDP